MTYVVHLTFFTSTNHQSQERLNSEVMKEHLTVAEVAEILDVSRDTVRRMFCEEPGVVNVGPQKGNACRPYRILRIPRSVLERFITTRSVNRKESTEE